MDEARRLPSFILFFGHCLIWIFLELSKGGVPIHQRENVKLKAIRNCKDEQDVREICLECLETKFQKLQQTCKMIREGKLKSRRHDDFKKGGKWRRNLDRQSYSLKVYTEEQSEFALRWLKSNFCEGGDSLHLDYILQVLQDELLIRVLGGTLCLNFEDAECLARQI